MKSEFFYIFNKEILPKDEEEKFRSMLDHIGAVKRDDYGSYATYFHSRTFEIPQYLQKLGISRVLKHVYVPEFTTEEEKNKLYDSMVEDGSILKMYGRQTLNDHGKEVLFAVKGNYDWVYKYSEMGPPLLNFS